MSNPPRRMPDGELVDWLYENQFDRYAKEYTKEVSYRAITIEELEQSVMDRIEHDVYSTEKYDQYKELQVYNSNVARSPYTGGVYTRNDVDTIDVDDDTQLWKIGT